MPQWPELPPIDPIREQIQSSYKPTGAWNWLRLNNRPMDILHNHEQGRGRIVYVGFSAKNPEYHLFQCASYSTPPRKRVTLKPFDYQCFTVESKAGQGGCSMRGCPGSATEMNTEETKAYCDACAARVRGRVQCPSTTIELCTHRMGTDRPPYGRPCRWCEKFEVTTA